MPAVLAVLVLLFTLERLFPLRRPTRRLPSRLLVNGAMSVLTLGVATFLVRPAALMTLSWSAENSFGLFHLIHTAPWLEGVLSFLLLDLSFYYWHRLNHALPFLWRFHNVHHLDPDLDASTGFRFHFAEVGISIIFRISQVGLLGLSLPVLIIYEFVFQVAVYFHHSNLHLPLSLERGMNYFFVTPRIHGIHHSQIREETDANYSVIFSFWDRVHRTFVWRVPQSEITIGVPGYSLPSDNLFYNVLLAPFRRQRAYWAPQRRGSATKHP